MHKEKQFVIGWRDNNVISQTQFEKNEIHETQFEKENWKNIGTLKS